MFKATREIYDTLSANKDLKVFVEESEKSSYVWLSFEIKNGGSYRIRFISRDDDNDVAVRIYRLVTVEEDKIPKILPAINDINGEWRFAKFNVDEDGDVNIAYDFPESCSNPAECAEEIIIRLVKIVDDAYAKIMQAIWA